LFFSAGRDFFLEAFVGNEGAWRTIHLEGEPVELIEIILGAGMRTFDLADVAATDIEKEGEIILRVTVGLPVVCHEPDDREVELRFSCLSHRRCKKMKRMCYLAYKIISKILTMSSGAFADFTFPRSLIEELLKRIRSKVDVVAAEPVIARLPAEYSMVLDLHYDWGLSRREIAALLDWSTGKVSQRLTRAISLLKYELHPEAFRKAQELLNRAL
jgi:hypothetical protein